MNTRAHKLTHTLSRTHSRTHTHLAELVADFLALALRQAAVYLEHRQPEQLKHAAVHGRQVGRHKEDEDLSE